MWSLVGIDLLQYFYIIPYVVCRNRLREDLVRNIMNISSSFFILLSSITTLTLAFPVPQYRVPGFRENFSKMGLSPSRVDAAGPSVSAGPSVVLGPPSPVRRTRLKMHACSTFCLHVYHFPRLIVNNAGHQLTYTLNLLQASYTVTDREEVIK